MKTYKVEQYTCEEWEERSDAMIESGNYQDTEDIIQIVWCEGKAMMDITANGKRIVPILRKIEKAMTEAGLAGDNGIYAGWFGSWADSLTDKTEKPYFIWNYSGKQDAENGHWSYSWGIEQLADDLWYVFLNIATASSGITEYLEKKQAM